MAGVRIEFEDNARETRARIDRLDQTLKQILTKSKVKIDLRGNIAGRVSQLNKRAAETTKLFSRAGTSGNKAFKSVDRNVDGLTKKMTGLTNTLRNTAAAFAAIFSVGLVNRATDNLTNIQNRLRIIITDADKLRQKESELFAISKRARADFGSAVQLYVDFQQALSAKGVSDNSIKQAVETVLKAGALSGSSQAGLQGAIIQLTQGISGGAIRGEELNSVLENMGFLGKGLRDILQKDSAALREFAEAGRLSPEIFLGVLEKLKPKADEAFESLTIPVELALNRLKAALSRFVAQVSQRFDISAGFTRNITSITVGVEELSSSFNGLAIRFRRLFNGMERDANASSQGISRSIGELILAFSDTVNGDVEGIFSRRSGESFNALRQRTKALAAERKELERTLSARSALQDLISRSSVLGGVQDAFAQLSFAEMLDASVGPLNAINGAVSAIIKQVLNATNILPALASPVLNIANEIDAVLTGVIASTEGAVADAVISAGRNVEGFFDNLVLNIGTDRRLERSIVRLFNTRSIQDFNEEVKEVFDILDSRQTRNIGFLGRELFRETNELRVFIREFKTFIGLSDSLLINVVDLPLERLFFSLKRLGRVVERVYTDIFIPKIRPVVITLFKELELRILLLSRAFRNSFNADTGSAVGTAIAGFVTRLAVSAKDAARDISKVDIQAFFESGGISRGSQNRLFRDVKETVLSLGAFIIATAGSFATTIGAPILDIVSRLFTRVMSDILTAIDAQSAKIAGTITDTLGAFLGIDLDVFTDLGDIFAPLKTLFSSLPDIARNGLRDTVILVRNFAVQVKDYFFQIWDEVVGNSFWPDTIDGVVDYTGNIEKALSKIRSFSGNVIGAFRDIGEQAGGALGPALGDKLANTLTSLDLTSRVQALSKGAITLLLAALGIIFGDPRIKFIALTNITNLLGDAFGGSFDLLGESVEALMTRLFEAAGPSLLAGFTNAVNFLVQNIPVLLRSVLAAISPLADATLDVINVGGIVNISDVIGAAVAGLLVFSAFTASPRATISEVIFGAKDANGAKTKKGITGMIGSLFGLGSALNGLKSPKLFGAGVAVLLTSLLSSINIFEAAVVGLPLIFAGAFDTGAGLRLGKMLLSWLSSPIIEVFKRVAQRPAVQTAAAAFRLRLQGLLNFSGAGVSAGATSELSRATRRLGAGIKRVFTNFRANAEKFGKDNKFSLSDALFSTIRDDGAGNVSVRRFRFDKIWQSFTAAFIKASSVAGTTIRDVIARVMLPFTSNGARSIAGAIRGSKAPIRDAFKVMFATLVNGLGVVRKLLSSTRFFDILLFGGIAFGALGSGDAFAGGLEETMKTFFQNPLAGIVDIVTKMFQNLADTVGAILGALFDNQLTRSIGGVFDSLLTVSGEVRDTAVGAFATIAGSIAGLITTLFALKLAYISIIGLSKFSFRGFEAFFTARRKKLREILADTGRVNVSGFTQSAELMTAGFRGFFEFTRKEFAKLTKIVITFTKLQLFSAQWWRGIGTTIASFFALFTQGPAGILAAFTTIGKGLLAILAPIKVLVAVLAGAAIVGGIALLLFGDDEGDGLESRIDRMIDKVRVLAGLAPKTAAGQSADLFARVANLQVGGQKLSLDTEVRRIDTDKLTDDQFKNLQGFFDDALKIFDDIEKRFQRNGRLLASDVKLSEETFKDLKALISKQPQKAIESFEIAIARFIDPTRRAGQSLADLARNAAGLAPILTQADFASSQFTGERQLESTIGFITNTFEDTVDFFFRLADAIDKAPSIQLGPNALLFDKGSRSLVISEFKKIEAVVAKGLSEVVGGIRKTATKALQDLQGAPSPGFVDLQKRVAEVSKPLTAVKDFLPDEELTRLEDITDRFFFAAELVEEFRRGFRQSRDRTFENFSNNFQKAIADQNKLQAEFFKTAAELTVLGQDIEAVRALDERIKSFADRVKTFLGVDFKEGAKFFGTDADIKRFDALATRAEEIKTALASASDITLRASLLLEKAQIDAQAAEIAQALESRISIEARGLALAKLLDFDAAGPAFSNALRQFEAVADTEGRGIFAALFSQLTDLTAIKLPVTATLVEQQELADSLADVQNKLVEALPLSTTFENINKALKLAGADALTESAFLAVDATTLSAINASVKRIVQQRNLLESVVATEGLDATVRERQAITLRRIRGELAAINSAVRAGIAGTIGNIAADEGLSTLSRALQIADALETTLDQQIILRVGGLQGFIDLNVELAEVNAQLERLKLLAVSGAAIDPAAFVKLTREALNLNKALTGLTSDAKTAQKGVDSMVSALSLAGIDTDVLGISRLRDSARTALAGVAREITAITEKLNRTDPGAAVFPGLVARRQSLLGEARRLGEDLGSNTGRAIQSALEAVGLFDNNAFSGTRAQIQARLVDASRLTNVDPGALERLQDFAAVFNTLEFKIRNARNLEEFLELRRELFENQRGAANLADDVTATFTTALGEINEIFKTDLDLFSFSTVAPEARRFLREISVFFKRELKNVEEQGKTISGISIEAFARSFRQVTRAGEYLSFFSAAQQDLETAFFEGAKSSISRINNLSGFNFDDIDLGLLEGRREFAVKLTNLDAFEKALDLPGLTQGMVDVLEAADLSDLDGTMARFRSQFGVDLANLSKSPLEINSIVTENLTTATRELIATMKGESFDPQAFKNVVSDSAGSGDAQVSGAALIGVLAARLQFAVEAIGRESDLRTRAGLSGAVTGVQFDPATLNRATQRQLREIDRISNAIAATTGEVLSLRAAGLPTAQLQGELDKYTFELEQIPRRIQGATTQVQEAGQEFASNFNSTLKTALSGALKGETGVFDALLDSLTSGIIDTLVRGLTDPLTGENGILNQTLAQLGGGVASLLNPQALGLFGGEQAEDGGPRAIGAFAEIATPITGAIESNTAAQGGFFASLGSLLMGGLSNLRGILGNVVGLLGGLFTGGSSGGGFLGTFFQVASLATSAAGAGAGASSFPGASTFSRSSLGFAAGGAIAGPGSGTSDSILARLSNGEFVVRAKSAAKHADLLRLINQDRLPKFNTGGQVGGSAAKGLDTLTVNRNSSTGEQQIFNITVTGDISRQTRLEVSRLIPEIAAGVNTQNKNRGTDRRK